MSESTSNMSPLEQMNQLLADKKSLIAAELEKLSVAKKELQDFQTELTVKVKQIQEEQENIKKDKADLAKEWDKLKQAQKNLETSMEQVLEEKLKQEKESLSDFKKLLSDESANPAFSLSENEFDINALRESIGLDTKSRVNNIREIDVETHISEPKVPALFSQIEKEIGKSYPKWTKLELIPERYCLQFGEKEIRFFDVSEQNKIPCVQIIVFTKNTKSDNKLLSNLAGAARVSPEWSINTEDNKIVCTMQFTNETKASAVLKKCSDFIKNYLS